MKEQRSRANFLGSCRALDLTDEKGFLCGKILADLGADVIKIEKPGGSQARGVGPFWHDIPEPEKSLYWFAYNTSKKGITLDIESGDGKEIFKKLLNSSDFVLESGRPGYMADIGLGYPDLCKVNPGIILTSITPFGQTGPYRDYNGPDIVVMAMSGVLYQTGDPDRPPVNIGIPQSYLHAGADAAVGSLIAYYHREMTGEGQHIDVSAQQSTARFLSNAVPFWELQGTILKRAGHFRTGLSSSAVQRQIWQCKDGYVVFVMLGGVWGAKTCRELTGLMDREGMSTEYLNSLDWDHLDMVNITQEEVDRIAGPVHRFFLAHTKKELWDMAKEKGIQLSPISDVEDLLNDPHLEHRSFWTQVGHPELGTSITYPGNFILTSDEPGPRPFRAPLIGEHNEEIYAELGLSTQDLVTLKEAGVI